MEPVRHNLDSREPYHPLSRNEVGKVIVVMPADNTERTLTRTVDDLSRRLLHDVIVVDDVSLAQSLGLTS